MSTGSMVVDLYLVCCAMLALFLFYGLADFLVTFSRKPEEENIYESCMRWWRQRAGRHHCWLLRKLVRRVAGARMLVGKKNPLSMRKHQQGKITVRKEKHHN
ncbi:unknown protein [Desulfotalea psychrophila LSv54]|uniref:Uncharacterized protein n=2 Tax=Desulfotalea psychrophila TaxID=84980 RepID=Q6ALL8_DESPS|nr:unknown protein [Desulfotalea psychrophila LSv54]